MKKIPSDQPMIYVGTYEKYNNGSIDGAWISLEGHDKESFYKEIKELHKDEADPEFMFQDYECFPKDFYGESGLDERIWEWLELNEEERKLVAMYAEAVGGDFDLSEAQDCFHGTFESEAEFAENFSDQMGDIPESTPDYIKNCIDWERVWNYSPRYDYSTSTDENGDIWFFHN